LSVEGNSLGLSFPAETARGDVALNNAFVDVSANSSGSVSIYAHNLDAFNSLILNTTVTGNGGNILLDAAEEFSFRGNDALIESSTTDIGTGGDVIVNTKQLLVQSGAQISTFTESTGQGGSLAINAQDSVTVSDASTQYPSALFAITNGSGRGGNITINTRQLTVQQGGQIETQVNNVGQGGDLIMNADVVNLTGATNRFSNGLFALASEGSSGNAGNIAVNTRQLTVQDGAVISTFTFGKGNAGNININALDSVSLSGFNTTLLGEIPSYLDASTSDSGDAGDVTITTGQLSLQDGAFISTSTTGAGNGGNIIINASDSVTFLGSVTTSSSTISNIGSALNTSTYGSGDAGDVTITTGQLTLQDGAFISALTSSAEDGSGDAGDVTIATGQLTLQDGAFISTFTTGDGEGGNIIINASDSLTLLGSVTTSSSTFGSSLNTSTYGSGDAGDVTITTGQLTVQDGGFISTGRGNPFTGTSSTGNAGNITINASDSVTLSGNAPDGRGSALSALTEGSGDGGVITITTRQLTLQDGAEIITAATGEGNAGNITINASDSVTLSGSTPDGKLSTNVSTFTLGNGNAGDITITTGQLTLQDGAFVSTNTSTEGKGGNIIINASDSVTLSGSFTSPTGEIPSALLTTTFGSGDAGSLTINTGPLTVQNGAAISTETASSGAGGDLIINASDSVTLSGTTSNGEFSSFLLTSTFGSGDAGNLTINTGRLTVQNGAAISTATASSGAGGDLTINAFDSVTLSGITSNGELSSRLLASAFGSGDAGRLFITTGQLTVQDGAEIDAASFGSGDAGDITINARDLALDGGTISGTVGTEAIGDGSSITITADRFEATNGGNVTTTTDGASPAGSITLVVSDDITLSGADSGLFANTSPGSTGAGGDISVDPNQVNITNGAAISVNSEGQGNAGNIRLQASSLTLDNGTISAETRSGEGGSINLGVNNLLLMDNNSTISSTAGGSGNGGNLTVDTNFLVANNNSDITANAFQGQGGNIQITAEGIFRSFDSDITASSQLGVSGTVRLNTPDTDPSRGTVNLPTGLVDASGLIAQNCYRPVQTANQPSNQSEFIMTGKGGLPPSLGEVSSGETAIVGLVLPERTSVSQVRPTVSSAANSSQPAEIVEAQGWIVDNNGDIVLTAQSPSSSLQGSWVPPASCNR
jgi:large exoprotein involved in heme utilization and adhesion